MLPGRTLMFTGEMMICSICKKKEQSDPNVESGWTLIELDGYRFYVCPKHLGNRSWTSEQHTKAYIKVLTKLSKKVQRKRAARG